MILLDRLSRQNLFGFRSREDGVLPTRVDPPASRCIFRFFITSFKFTTTTGQFGFLPLCPFLDVLSRRSVHFWMYWLKTGALKPSDDNLIDGITEGLDSVELKMEIVKAPSDVSLSDSRSWLKCASGSRRISEGTKWGRRRLARTPSKSAR